MVSFAKAKARGGIDTDKYATSEWRARRKGGKEIPRWTLPVTITRMFGS